MTVVLQKNGQTSPEKQQHFVDVFFSLHCRHYEDDFEPEDEDMSPDTHNLGSGEPRHTDLNKRGVQKSSKSIEDDIYDFSNSASSY